MVDLSLFLIVFGVSWPPFMTLCIGWLLTGGITALTCGSIGFIKITQLIPTDGSGKESSFLLLRWFHHLAPGSSVLLY